MQHRTIKALPFLVAAIALAGFTSCEHREIVTPKAGSTRVFSIDHPVTIRTNDAKGAVTITARNFETGERTMIYFNPEGDAEFNDVIPPEYWKCADTGWGQPPSSNITRGGCVASLQVSDDQGPFYTTRTNNKLYVCTENYYQVGDRRHCDPRSIDLGKYPPFVPGEPISTVLEWRDYNFRMKYSHPTPRHDYVRNWEGDHAQLLFSGFHEWRNTNNSWDPAFPHDRSGSWQEFAYSTTKLKNPTFVSGDMYSVDIGVCSEFIPWKWEDRDPNGGLNDLVGGFTNNLGIGEVIVNGMADNPIRESIYTEDAKLWTDTLTELWQRPDSAEFHFRVSDGNERQMCFVQYVAANNRLQSRPDAWFRFDQAFLALFLELFRIGDCPTHNARIQYCGGIQYDADTQTAEFVVDPSTAIAYMEPYGLFRPACRKQFHSRFVNEFPGRIAEPAGQALTDSLALLMTSLPAVMGADIRRIETTPRGMYLVLAESEEDPQYGKGQCVRTLEGAVPPDRRNSSDWSWPSVPATGIRRPL